MIGWGNLRYYFVDNSEACRQNSFNLELQCHIYKSNNKNVEAWMYDDNNGVS